MDSIAFGTRLKIYENKEGKTEKHHTVDLRHTQKLHGSIHLNLEFHQVYSKRFFWLNDLSLLHGYLMEKETKFI